jgi:hypothetical protein
MENKRLPKGKGPKKSLFKKKKYDCKDEECETKIILPDTGDNNEEFLEEIMEAICPQNFDELEWEPLEGDFVLVQYVIDGKNKFSMLEK